MFWRGCRGKTLEAISFSPLRCPGNYLSVPRYAIHGATDPRRIMRRRRPLLFFKDESTWLEASSQLGYFHISKRKSTRFHGCFFFCLTGNYLSSQAASSQVLSAYVGLTAVFGLGTGGTPQLSSPDCLTEFAFACSLKTPHRKKIDCLRSRSSSLSLRTKRLTPFSCAVRGSLAY